MEVRPRLRVVILNFDHAALTEKCVESVFMQNYCPLDVLVVDNGSCDAEFRELERLLDRRDNRVFLVRTIQNLGYAAGNNVGARTPSIPRPDFVMFLNNDVELMNPATCDILIAALKRNTNVVACSPLVHTEGVDRPSYDSVQVRRIPDFWTVLGSSGWLRRLPGMYKRYEQYTYADQRPYPRNTIIECETINGSCFVIRNDFLEEIGYLDEGTFLYCEEIILGWQIRSRGKKACLATGIEVEHKQGATSGHGRHRFVSRMKLEMLRSEQYYCLKYLQAPAYLRLLLLSVRAIDFLTQYLIHKSRRFFG